MSQFWDDRFAEPGYKYGTEPNAFLRTQAMHLAPGSRVLVPGDGEGRNSVWLAQRGHKVRAMDSSQKGLAKGMALAADRGVVVERECADLADCVLPEAAYDALALIYVHMPSALRRTAHQRLARTLVPGGWVIIECFQPDQLGRPSGGPKDRDMLASLATLRDDFGGLCTEVLGWEGEVTLDEGPGHQGAALVTRYVGRRV